MDGNFVPTQAFGGNTVSNLKDKDNLVLDVHLMINKPELHLDEYKDADIITVHEESTSHLYRCISYIKKMGIKAGVAINPGTPIIAVDEVLDIVDQVMVMTINPGMPEESFIERALKKIETLSKMKTENDYSFDIEVDGNINEKAIVPCVKCGANIFVSGRYLFEENDLEVKIRELKRIISDCKTNQKGMEI